MDGWRCTRTSYSIPPYYHNTIQHYHGYHYPSLMGHYPRSGLLRVHPIRYCHTQLNTKLGRLFFPKKPHHTTTTKPKPSITFSQLLHNQTRPNSVCNLSSTQQEDSCKKVGVVPSCSWCRRRLPDQC